MVVHDVRLDEGAALLEMLESLRQAAQGQTDITIRILAANDHDGVCATKILVTVLHSKGLKYSVVPVTGYGEIIEQMQQLEEDNEVRSLVFLNCGAGLDLQEYLHQCAAPAWLRCYVIDAHRPFLMSNLSKKSDRVFVYDDDPRLEDGTGIRPTADSDEDSIDETRSLDGDNPDDEDIAEEFQEASSSDRAARAERKRKREAERAARRERKRQRVNDYYVTSYYAMPAAVSLFKMARQAALDSQDLLWAAAVSLVGYYEQGFLGKLDYDRLAWEELKEALDRTEDFSMSAPSQSLETATLGSDEENFPARRRTLQSGGAAKRQLRFEPDFRLLLYKHWTLEESIKHSGYFYGTMELHRDKGARALKNFFATAGISPGNYKQLYSSMSLPIRRTMQEKFSEFGKGYGLSKDKMFLQQFVRSLGPLGESKHSLWLQEVSCSDASHILLTLLGFVPANLSNSRLDLLPQNEQGRKDADQIEKMERQAAKDNFWRAFDTVLCKDPGPLRDGIEDAVEVAKAVQTMGRFIKDTNALRKSRFFQWCKIEQPPHLFRHHMAVRRLAVWLLQVFFTYRPQGETVDRPLLIIVRDQVRETYLCVGATPNRLTDRDEFAHLFRSALRADRTLKYRYDYFDKSVIEIAIDDFDRFWELLNECA